MTEVYFNESNLLRNDNGIITSLSLAYATTPQHEGKGAYMNEVIQNCLSRRNGNDFDPGNILPTT